MGLGLVCSHDPFHLCAVRHSLWLLRIHITEVFIRSVHLYFHFQLILYQLVKVACLSSCMSVGGCACFVTALPLGLDQAQGSSQSQCSHILGGGHTFKNTSYQDMVDLLPLNKLKM